MLRLFRHISLRQLRTSAGRTGVVVGGVAIGISLVVAINIINTSALANFRQSIELVAGPASLEVTLGVGEVGFPEDWVKTVRADPDVAAVVPLVRGTVALADDPRETLQLFGADLTNDEDLGRYGVSLDTGGDDPLVWLNDPRSIAVTTSFAKRHGIGIGRTVLLSTPGGVGRFTVRGILNPEGMARAFGGTLALMDLPAAQVLLGKAGRVDQIDVIVRPATDIESVQRRLQSALPATLNVERPVERGMQYERVVSSFQALLTGVSMLCLIAGVFIVYNTTATGAAHRAVNLARLRIIGIDETRMFRVLMFEALVLGVVGTAIGMVGGKVLAWLVSPMVTDSMGIIFQLRFSIDQLVVDGWSVATIVFLGVGATLVSSYFAARWVAATEPLEVLRGGVSTSAPHVRSNRTLLMSWVILVLGSASTLAVQEWSGSIAVGNVAATLWNASVIVVAVPLVDGIGGVLLRVLPAAFTAEGKMAAEALLRSATRTGITVAAIALVLTIGVMLSSLIVSFRRSMLDYVGGVLAGDLVVSAVSTEGGWLETPLPAEFAVELSTVPGVKSVDSLRVLPGQVYRDLRIAVGGLTDGFFDVGRYPKGWYREGDPARAAAVIRAGKGANISTGLSRRAGLHVGDEIVLDTPTGRLPLSIVGVVPDYASDRGSVLLSRRLLVDRWLEPTLSRINVTVEPGTPIEVVRQRIVERFGDDYRLKVLSIGELLAYHDRMIDRAFAFADAIQILIIVVTIAGILDLLASSLIERRRELALWRLIGADDEALRRSIVIESSTIGALGAALGAGAGVVTAWMWIVLNFRHLLGYELERHFAYGAILSYAALVMVITFLAGRLVGRSATRQDIIGGIQVE
jgi:putative ABC transport system permease protein